jgi:hypothetical protein
MRPENVMADTKIKTGRENELREPKEMPRKQDLKNPGKQSFANESNARKKQSFWKWKQRRISMQRPCQRAREIRATHSTVKTIRRKKTRARTHK